jgi:hypothetical protein
MMPTTYRAEINHKPFSSSCASREMSAYLSARREQILRLLGFYDEYGDPSEWTADAETESQNVIGTIVGILLKTAAIAVDAGFKAPNQVAATLQAIFRKPELVRKNRDQIEPEALGVLAKYYDRGDGMGKHPFDILGHPKGRTRRTEVDGSLLSELDDSERRRVVLAYRQDRASTVDNANESSGSSNNGKGRMVRRPKDSAIRTATEKGKASLRITARPGRRTRVDLDVLAGELAGLFRQYSGRLVTRIVHPQRARSEAPPERGGFKDFLELVLPALEGVLAQYPNVPHRISRNSLVRELLNKRAVNDRP